MGILIWTVIINSAIFAIHFRYVTGFSEQNLSCAAVAETDVKNETFEATDFCPYPYLFSTQTTSCEPFNDVDCGNRSEPLSPCDYPNSNCSYPQGSNVSLCTCPENTDLNFDMCLALKDGSHVWPARRWSPYYITCSSKRTLATQCSGASIIYNFFENQCESVYSVVNKAYSLSLSLSIPVSLHHLISPHPTLVTPKTLSFNTTFDASIVPTAKFEFSPTIQSQATLYPPSHQTTSDAKPKMSVWTSTNSLNPIKTVPTSTEFSRTVNSYSLGSKLEWTLSSTKESVVPKDENSLKVNHTGTDLSSAMYTEMPNHGTFSSRIISSSKEGYLDSMDVLSFFQTTAFSTAIATDILPSSGSENNILEGIISTLLFQTKPSQNSFSRVDLESSVHVTSISSDLKPTLSKESLSFLSSSFRSLQMTATKQHPTMELLTDSVQPIQLSNESHLLSTGHTALTHAASFISSTATSYSLEQSSSFITVLKSPTVYTDLRVSTNSSFDASRTIPAWSHSLHSSSDFVLPASSPFYLSSLFANHLLPSHSRSNSELPLLTSSLPVECTAYLLASSTSTTDKLQINGQFISSPFTKDNSLPAAVIQMSSPNITASSDSKTPFITAMKSHATIITTHNGNIIGTSLSGYKMLDSSGHVHVEYSSTPQLFSQIKQMETASDSYVSNFDSSTIEVSNTTASTLHLGDTKPTKLFTFSSSKTLLSGSYSLHSSAFQPIIDTGQQITNGLTLKSELNSSTPASQLSTSTIVASLLYPSVYHSKSKIHSTETFFNTLLQYYEILATSSSSEITPLSSNTGNSSHIIVEPTPLSSYVLKNSGHSSYIIVEPTPLSCSVLENTGFSSYIIVEPTPLSSSVLGNTGFSSYIIVESTPLSSYVPENTGFSSYIIVEPTPLSSYVLENTGFSSYIIVEPTPLSSSVLENTGFSSNIIVEPTPISSNVLDNTGYLSHSIVEPTPSSRYVLDNTGHPSHHIVEPTPSSRYMYVLDNTGHPSHHIVEPTPYSSYVLDNTGYLTPDIVKSTPLSSHVLHNSGHSSMDIDTLRNNSTVSISSKPLYSKTTNTANSQPATSTASTMLTASNSKSETVPFLLHSETITFKLTTETILGASMYSSSPVTPESKPPSSLLESISPQFSADSLSVFFSTTKAGSIKLSRELVSSKYTVPEISLTSNLAMGATERFSVSDKRTTSPYITSINPTPTVSVLSTATLSTKSSGSEKETDSSSTQEKDRVIAIAIGVGIGGGVVVIAIVIFVIVWLRNKVLKADRRDLSQVRLPPELFMSQKL